MLGAKAREIARMTPPPSAISRLLALDRSKQTAGELGQMREILVCSPAAGGSPWRDAAPSRLAWSSGR